jgi:hypothetical protein
VGNSRGHQRGDLVTVSGEDSVALDTRLSDGDEGEPDARADDMPAYPLGSTGLLDDRRDVGVDNDITTTRSAERRMARRVEVGQELVELLVRLPWRGGVTVIEHVARTASPVPGRSSSPEPKCASARSPPWV